MRTAGRTLVAAVWLSAACGRPTTTERTPTEAGASGAAMTMGGSAGVGAAGGATAGASGAGRGGAAGESAGAGGAAGGKAGSAPGGAAAGDGAAGAAGSSAGPFPPGVTKPKLMIVGDSISAGPGCYKKYLLQNLTANHYSRFEFVGEYVDDCGSSVRHSAVSCSTSEQYTQPTFMLPNCSQGKTFPGLSTLMAAHSPDLVMLQLGVNDVWGGRSTEQILASYEALVKQSRAQNPRVVLVVAQIQKIRPDCGSDDSVQKRAESLVMAVPAWASRLSTASSPIFVADLWTGSDWSMAETTDCVHPNDAGAQRMGMSWFKALSGILEQD
jgi:GDSL-like Lipase/Acylhydrolase family